MKMTHDYVLNDLMHLYKCIESYYFFMQLMKASYYILSLSHCIVFNESVAVDFITFICFGRLYLMNFLGFISAVHSAYFNDPT